MVISDCTVGMGITGSFCSFEKTKDVAKRLVDSFTHVTPVYSYNAQMMNTRFGKAGDFMHTISEITGDEGIRTLQEAERVGPGKLFDVMVIYPCTGNTAAKLANGIVDTPVLLAAKAHLRNGRPLVIGISTNDALGINFKNIGKLMNMKIIYFVPDEKKEGGAFVQKTGYVKKLDSYQKTILLTDDSCIDMEKITEIQITRESGRNML